MKCYIIEIPHYVLLSQRSPLKTHILIVSHFSTQLCSVQPSTGGHQISSKLPISTEHLKPSEVH